MKTQFYRKGHRDERSPKACNDIQDNSLLPISCLTASGAPKFMKQVLFVFSLPLLLARRTSPPPLSKYQIFRKLCPRGPFPQ